MSKTCLAMALLTILGPAHAGEAAETERTVEGVRAVAPRIPAVHGALDSIGPAPAGEAAEAASEAAALDARLDAIEAIMNTPLAAAAAGEAGDSGTTARVFALQAGLRDVEARLQQMPSTAEVSALVTEVRRLQEELPAVAAEARQAGVAARA